MGDRVTLAGGLEVLYCPYPGMPQRPVTREEATGAAVAVLSGGADIVYLFNYFQHGRVISEYQRMLKSFSSLEELLKLPRRHAVTFRDVTALGENYRAPLPASGTTLSFSVPLGPAPAAGWQAEATIECAARPADEKPPAISINGTAGALRRDEPLKNGNRLLTAAFPLTAFPGQNRDLITIAAAGKNPVKVHRVEVSLRP